MADSTIYPYGTNGQLPSDIGVINDFTTGGADKALSAEMGTKISGYKVLDLSSYEKISTLIMTSTGKWADNSPYKSIFVPVDSGDTYEITANSNTSASYAVLTSASHTNGDTPAYATGYSSKESIPAGGSETLIMPNDAEYLWFLVVGDNSIDKTPALLRKFVGSIIDKKIDERIVNDLTTGGADKMLSAEMGREMLSKIESVPLDLSDYPDVSGIISTTLLRWVCPYKNYKFKLIPLTKGKTYVLTAQDEQNSSYALLASNSHENGTTPVYAEGFTGPASCPAGGSIELSITENGVYLYVVVYTTADKTPKSIVMKSDLDERLSSVGGSRMPSLLLIGEPTNIIYTIDDLLLAHDYIEGSVDTLKVSNDLGKTWTIITESLTNDYGYVVNAFMFADGTFMMACKKSDGCRIYWTRDFSTFEQATIYDMDGNGNHVTYYAEANTTRFHILKPKSYHAYVNGVEHYCFWDYTISTGYPRLWYAISDENGVTVRAAFVFGISSINGSTIYARHGHAFEYNPYDGYFYALTGDANDECHVMRGRYVDDNGTHRWTWEKLATGGGYKLTSVTFDEGNLYAVTDYTESALSAYKGIVSIPINMIGLTTTIGGVVCPLKLRYWFHATDEFMRGGSYNSSGSGSQLAAMSGSVVDNHGWRIVGTDYLGSSKHMIAKGGHNFVWVDNNRLLKFFSFIGPNNLGDVYAKGREPGPSYVSGEEWLRLSHEKFYNITEAMRKSGAKDFFDGWLGTPR